MKNVLTALALIFGIVGVLAFMASRGAAEQAIDDSRWWCVRVADGTICGLGKDSCELRRQILAPDQSCYSPTTVWGYTYRDSSGAMTGAISHTRVDCDTRRAGSIAAGARDVSECREPSR